MLLRHRLTIAVLLHLATLIWLTDIAHAAPPEDFPWQAPPNADWSVQSMNSAQVPFRYVEAPSMTPRIKGSILIFADWGQNPMARHALSQVVADFPQLGYQVLASSGPAVKLGSEITAQDSGASRYQWLAKPALDSVKEQLTEQLMLLQNKSLEQPGYHLIVATGHTASLLLPVMFSSAKYRPDALVLLSMGSRDDELNQQTLEVFTKLRLPVLEIYQSGDPEYIKQGIAQRQRHARKQMAVGYRVRQLFSEIDHLGQGPRVSKEIQGWLRSLGY